MADRLKDGVTDIWSSDYVQKNVNKAYKVTYNSEYLAVAAFLNGGAEPANWQTFSRLGKGLCAIEVERRLLAEPATDLRLHHAPPTLTNPMVINVDTTNILRPKIPVDRDWIMVMPDYPITADGGICPDGGRNGHIIGGEVFNQTAHVPPFDMWRQIGLYLPNSKGIVHIEGLWIHGVGVGDCLQTGTGSTTADVRIQKCRFQSEHRTQQIGSHPDILQTYAGPAYWRMDQNTYIANGTIRTWQPTEFGPNIKGVEIRRQDWIAQQSHVEYGTYAIWDDLPSGTWWPEYHEDIWFWVDDAHDSFHGLHRYNGSGNGDAPNGFTPGQYGITGEAIKWGLRPEGNWVPSALVKAGTFDSPGYI